MAHTKVTCPSCSKELTVDTSKKTEVCACGNNVIVKSAIRIGSGVTKLLSSVGITKERVSKVAGDCNCSGREAALNNLTHFLLGNEERDLASERTYKKGAAFVPTRLLHEVIRHRLYPELMEYEATALVGVPRSGMMVAAQLSMYMHLPLFSFSDGEVVNIGTGVRSSNLKALGRRPVLVDDTSCSGKTMQHSDFPRKVVALATTHATKYVDFHGAILESPHILEWNVFNTTWANQLGLDMDGVVCKDCPGNLGDDNPKYIKFLNEVEPLNVPRLRSVKAIISARQEKYREQTVSWLRKYRAKYETLVLWPGDHRDRSPSAVSQWKAEWADKLGCHLYLESSKGITNLMDQHTVICTPVFVSK